MEPKKLPMPPRMITRSTMKPAEPCDVDPSTGHQTAGEADQSQAHSMVTMNTFSAFTPNKAATSGLKATVLMPRPIRVWLRNMCSASRTTTLMAIIATLSSPMTTPDPPVTSNTGGYPGAGAEHEQNELRQKVTT